MRPGLGLVPEHVEQVVHPIGPRVLKCLLAQRSPNPRHVALILRTAVGGQESTARQAQGVRGAEKPYDGVAVSSSESGAR